MLKKISSNLLDCTLRDGSYENNFGFTKNDTINICKSLEKAGVKYIEIGHGLGLGASKRTKFKAVESDETYLQAAKKALKKSRWGVFCIPGISKLDDLKKAADQGINFIRIGTNVEDYKKAEEFIELAKKLKIFVCSNYMKTYLVSPKKFTKYVRFSKNMGSDLVYIVDSAGGMFPEELEAYDKQIKYENIKIKLGFHGHNNLSMAVSNSLKAIELNFDLVDCSLQGFGRGAGNASSEQLICSLVRKNIDIGIDPIKIMDMSEKYIYKLINKKGYRPIDVISGLTLFHSSYMPIIIKMSKKYKIDPRELIISASNLDKSQVNEVTAEKLALKLRQKKNLGNWKNIYGNYYGQEQ